jgi:hypothetical protein
VKAYIAIWIVILMIVGFSLHKVGTVTAETTTTDIIVGVQLFTEDNHQDLQNEVNSWIINNNMQSCIDNIQYQTSFDDNHAETKQSAMIVLRCGDQ